MHESDTRTTVRKAARAFEQALPADQRKHLGQFFTGVPLGKVLAALALTDQTRTVLDPMAGHGDLLDATDEVAAACDIKLGRLDGIEINEATADTCRERLEALVSGENAPSPTILTGSAFEPSLINELPVPAYDLVITNPPYVRYQGRRGNGNGIDSVRSGLISIIDHASHGSSRDIWSTLAQGYSGLADLSVPSWLLAGYMVRPGGRLALVAPATWRSRNYAEAIRYLLLRYFSLELIVEDTQPGWFSDALVRTHLIVARRLDAHETREPLRSRTDFPTIKWLRIAPDAASKDSLVGGAFEGPNPETNFAAWARNDDAPAAHGIEVSQFDLRNEWAALRSRISRHRWYGSLEGGGDDLPLFATAGESVSAALPDTLRDLLLPHTRPQALVSLDEAGISVGQGLRTGCNPFFYVSATGPAKAGMVTVRLSGQFGGAEIVVPSDAVRPVLRRQSEMEFLERGAPPPGRVLDLRSRLLPEDAACAAQPGVASGAHGQATRQIMPDELAAFVRRAATQSLSGSDKLIPALSAVRTNICKPAKDAATARFWYMLPDFAPRHLPAAFTARIVHGSSWVECNADPPVLIDANFSTFWAHGGGWTPFSLKALLNSVWCRTFMEALGTPMGGGALKLEATHLRQMRVPRLREEAKASLDKAGRRLTRNDLDVQAQIDSIVLQAIVPDKTADRLLPRLARNMQAQAEMMRQARQRTAS